MEKTLSSLNETLIAANKTASVSTRLGNWNLTEGTDSSLYFRHTQGTSDLTVVDATFASNQCGSFVSEGIIFCWSSLPSCADFVQLENRPQLLQSGRCLLYRLCLFQWILQSSAWWLVPHLCLQQVQEFRWLQRCDHFDRKNCNIYFFKIFIKNIRMTASWRPTAVRPLMIGGRQGFALMR